MGGRLKHEVSQTNRTRQQWSAKQRREPTNAGEQQGVIMLCSVVANRVKETDTWSDRINCETTSLSLFTLP